MKYLILLILICAAYFFYNKRRTEPLSYKYHIYMGIFVSIYLFLYYTIKHKPNIAYKFANNITNVHKKPLHSLIPSYKLKREVDPIKFKLLNNQSFMCNICKQHISMDSVQYCKLSYINTLRSESDNNITNLQLLCPSCYEKYNQII